MQPESITEYAAGMERDLGAQVTVEQVRPQRYLVTAERGPWRVTVTLAPLKRGRLQQKASSLYHHGEPHPKAANYAALIAIFHEDETQEAETEIEVPYDQAPADVRYGLDRLRPIVRIAPGEWRAYIIRAGTHWIARVARGDNDMRLEIHCDESPMDLQKPGRTAPMIASKPALRLFVRGVDLTDQLQGKLERAATVIRSQGAASPSPVPAARDAAVDTGVAVRKQSVMRI